MEFKAAGITSAGGREINEDYCMFEQRDGFMCCIVADGLGGHKGGQMASKTAAGRIMEAFFEFPDVTPERMLYCFEEAQSAVMELQAGNRLLHSMKTTAVVLLCGHRQALWGHIGDSRLYYFKGGSLVFQTRDHSVPQAMVNAGEIREKDIRFHEDRNRLLRAIGQHQPPRFEILEEAVPIRAGDAFLLCTDGFWEYVYENEMVKDLRKSHHPKAWLDLMEKRLNRRADRGHDNYTAVAVMLM